MAVGAAALHYRVDANAGWQTVRCTVSGWGPAGALSFLAERSMTGGWAIDGTPRPDLAACTDIDLGFTPATNTVAIRRLALDEGAAADAVALWLREDDWTVQPMTQGYARTGPTAYDYSSDGFSARLQVSPDGLVTDYPGGWVAETPPAPG